MEALIKRIILRLWPELTGNLHLPKWGRVTRVPGEIAQGHKSEPLSPGYAVDIQVLNYAGEVDDELPIFKTVQLPVSFAGAGRGAFGFPEIGAIVELGFAFGLPSKPFIRAVLAEGQTLPALRQGDVLLSKDNENSYRIDADQNIGEQCQAVAERIAKLKQRVVVKDGGKVWVGSESDNVLALLGETMQQVINIADALAAHKHTGVMSGGSLTAPPDNAASYTAASTETGTAKGKLDSITE